MSEPEFRKGDPVEFVGRSDSLASLRGRTGVVVDVWPRSNGTYGYCVDGDDGNWSTSNSQASSFRAIKRLCPHCGEPLP